MGIKKYRKPGADSPKPKKDVPDTKDSKIQIILVHEKIGVV